MGSITQTSQSLLGEAHVTSWETLSETTKQRVQSAIAPEAAPPACIVYPETLEQIAEILTCAAQNQWRVLPCGRGSKLNWGSLLSGADIVVSTENLNQVVEHAEGDLTLTAEAGVPFAEVQKSLAKTRQFLALDPAYAHQATLGGIVATRDTGALRQRYGGIRDMLIGLSFIRHDGQAAKAGGRVVKNVAGYDLMKLMSGSFGSLGIITQVTFRTYPIPETSQTILLKGAADIIKGLATDILQSSLTPIKMDLLTSTLLAEHPPKTLGLSLQFQSIEAGVAEQVALLKELATPYALTLQDLKGNEDTQFWQGVGESLFDLRMKENGVITKIGILPAKAVDLLATLEATLTPNSWTARIHAGSGIGIVHLDGDRNTPDQLRAIRTYCQSAAGYLMILEAPVDWKTTMNVWGLTGDVTLLMSRLRNQFDPQHRLSPGRWG